MASGRPALLLYMTSSPPLPMLLEYAIGTVVAKAAVDDSLVCMVWDGVVPEER